MPPLVAPILRDRSLALVLSAVLLLQTGLTFLNLPGWQCPIFHAVGIPCPGCGLSRATTQLLHGDWDGALALHLFAPVALVAIAAAVVVTLLPEPRRLSAVHLIERIEVRTGIGLLVLVALFIYWGIRLLVAPDEFRRMIAEV